MEIKYICKECGYEITIETDIKRKRILECKNCKIELKPEEEKIVKSNN